MGYFISLTLIAVIQLTSTMAMQPIPFKCLLQEPVFMGIFNKTSSLPRFNASPLKHPLHFDTLKIDTVSFDQDGLQFESKDMKVKGIQDAILDLIEFNFETKLARLSVHADVFASGRYKAGGTLFLLPVEGEGPWILNIKNVQVYALVPFDVIDGNGVKLLDLKSYSFWYDVRDNAEFKFDNLYYGNKELSDSMHNLINQNWKLITVQFGKHYLNNVVSYMFNEFRNYFLDMPLKDFSTC